MPEFMVRTRVTGYVTKYVHADDSEEAQDFVECLPMDELFEMEDGDDSMLDVLTDIDTEIVEIDELGDEEDE